MLDFYLRARKAGDQNIHFADGFGLAPFGADGVYVDGIHPTTHGFEIMAERLSPQIGRVLLIDG